MESRRKHHNKKGPELVESKGPRPKQSQVDPAQRGLCVGRSGVGKSFSTFRHLLNRIKRGDWAVDHVILISPTGKSDPSQQPLFNFCKDNYSLWEKGNYFKDLDQPVIDLLTDIFHTQQALKESDDANHKDLEPWLIILDDAIGSAFLTSRNRTMTSLYNIGRHFSISMWILIQRYKLVMSPVLRDQVTDLCIYKLGQNSPLYDIANEFDEHGVGWKQIAEWIKDAYSSEDRCFVIHTLVDHGKGRFERGWTGYFYDKEQKHEPQTIALKPPPRQKRPKRGAADILDSDSDDI